MTRVVALLIGMVAACGSAFSDLPRTADDLYRLDRIWEVTLSMTPEAWDGLQPEEPVGGGVPFGGPGGPPGGSRPGGGLDVPGAPRGFGPGNFLAMGFMMVLDGDRDGALSRDEFAGGFGRWFAEWDAAGTGSVGSDQVREGLTRVLSPPSPGADVVRGPRPGAGAGPGGPGFGLQGREGQRNGLSAARGIHFDYVKANLTFDGVPFRDVAVRYKGNGTFMDALNTDKKSFKVDLNEFVKGQKIAGISKLNLHNNITEVASLHEPLAYELYRAAGVPAPRTAYARVTLDVPGSHTNRLLGLYSLVENPDSNWADANFGTRKGAIFKPVTRELFKFQGTDWSAYRQAYDAKTDLTRKQEQRVYDFARLITEADDAELARRLPEFLDVDEFSRFMAVTVWLSSTDSILMMGQNFVVYLHPTTDRFLFVPWDLDRAFGNFFNPSPEQLSIRNAWAEDNRFLQRVMQVPAVREAYLARLEEFQKTLFQPARFAAMVEEIAARIRPVVAEEDPGKLPAFDRSVAGQMAGPEGPGGGGSPFRMNAKPIKVFVKERHAAVAAQLTGASEGMPLFGGPGGPGRPGGRGGPGAPGPGGMRPFGPGEILGPVVFAAADADRDGRMTAAEFEALSVRWFSEWDKEGTGSLNPEQLAAGLTVLLPMPDFARPPARPF